MRKNIQLLLVIIFFISGIYAADNYGEIGTPANEPDSTAFQVKAFRIYEEEEFYANLVITNAMSSGLDRVNEGGAITISDHYLERYMGIVNGIDDPITSFSEHAIFSYRVEGNGKGNFTIKLDFQPFYLVGADTPTDTQWIRNAFELANETYEFNSTGNGSGENGEEIKYVSGRPVNADGSEVAGNERIAPEKGQTASFSRKWSVSDSTNGDSETTLDWAVRGAIALDIGPTTFDSAEYGTYRSAVTVTLTTQ